VLYAFDGARAMEAEGIATDARLAVVRREADGALSGGLVDGTVLTANGRPVPVP